MFGDFQFSVAIFPLYGLDCRRKQLWLAFSPPSQIKECRNYNIHRKSHAKQDTKNKNERKTKQIDTNNYIVLPDIIMIKENMAVI